MNLRASLTRQILMAPLALAAGLLAWPAQADKKTDVVVLINGDHITGEFKELAYGQMKFKTDHIGTIYVEWDKIVTFTTRQVLQVELADGRRYYGRSPQAAATPATMHLVEVGHESDGKVIDLTMAQVVRMSYVEQGGFFDRLDGSVSVGYSYTQATGVAQFNFSSDVFTRNSKRLWNLTLDANTSSQSDGTSSERALVAATHERFLPNRYYYEGTLSFTRNDELGLDLRSMISMTGGRYLVQRQGLEVRAGAGLAASRENRTDGTVVDSVELPLTASYKKFRLDSPKTDITLVLTLLPSLTESGRIRGEATVSARHEIVHDLFLEVSLYESYDNRPPEGSSSNDWNVVTSLGYTF